MIHFITFGDKKKCYKSACRLVEQINDTELFDTSEALNEEILIERYPHFQKHMPFIEKYRTRGFGCWLWKSFCVYHKLMELKENDILVYFDGGCEINMRAKDRLKLYIDYAYKNDFMGFGVETEIEYNKMELLKKFGVENNSKILNSKQCQGGLLLVKKCKRTMNLIKKWYEITHSDNYENITDTKDDSIQHKVIKDHRHDQAVLSLLVKTLGFKFIEDETWKSPFWHIDGKDIPVWAIRNKEEDGSLSLFNVYLNHSIRLRFQKQIKVGRIGTYNCDCVMFNYLVRIISPDVNIIWENSDNCDIILKGHGYPQYFTNKEKPIIYFSGEPKNVSLEKGENKYIEIGTLLEGNENNENFFHVPFLAFAFKCLYNDKLYINENPENPEPIFNNLLEVGKNNNNFDDLYMKRIYENNDRKYLCAWCACKSNEFRDKLFNTLVEKDVSKTVHSLGKQYGKYPETNRKIPGQNWNDINLIKQYSDYYFVLAIENCVKKGYVTEKILNAFYSGAIPVYYGDRSVFDYFNKEAFIYVNDFNSVEECVDYIVGLSNDKIKEMMSKPIFKENKLHEKLTLNHYPSTKYYKKISQKMESLLGNEGIQLQFS